LAASTNGGRHGSSARPPAASNFSNRSVHGPCAARNVIEASSLRSSSAEARATDDVSYGLGMVVRLREGATMSLTRAAVDTTSEGQVWMLTSLRFTGEGRAMVFRKLTVNHVIEWFDYSSSF
jgi:hypothetical protein